MISSLGRGMWFSIFFAFILAVLLLALVLGLILHHLLPVTAVKGALFLHFGAYGALLDAADLFLGRLLLLAHDSAYYGLSLS